MDIVNLLENKSLKPTEKRNQIIASINDGTFTINEIEIFKGLLEDKEMVVILEAMEAITDKDPQVANLKWLEFAKDYINADSNSLKRESSRIIGNIAYLYPKYLNIVIPKLLVNAKDKSTVIRWGSAYALGRIISIPKYAKSELYEIVLKSYQKERENGIKKQYQNGLTEAKKIRSEK